MKFQIGDKVQKVKGYRFPGTIVAAFTTLKGRRRYVVECSEPAVDGILHIYSGEDLMAIWRPGVLPNDRD